MSGSCDPMDCKPTRLLCPWDSPGKNIGVGCHFPSPGDLPDPGIEPGSPALQADSLSTELWRKSVHCPGGGLVAKRCLTLATPWTAAHQAPLSMEFSRQEYWGGLPLPFSRGSSQRRNRNWVSCTAGRFFTTWAMREAHSLSWCPIIFVLCPLLVFFLCVTSFDLRY